MSEAPPVSGRYELISACPDRDRGDRDSMPSGPERVPVAAGGPRHAGGQTRSVTHARTHNQPSRVWETIMKLSFCLIAMAGMTVGCSSDVGPEPGERVASQADPSASVTTSFTVAPSFDEGCFRLRQSWRGKHVTDAVANRDLRLLRRDGLDENPSTVLSGISGCGDSAVIRVGLSSGPANLPPAVGRGGTPVIAYVQSQFSG